MTGMTRRHFMTHVAGASALAVPGMQFLNGLKAAEAKLKKENKSLIILWMGGGPSHMDLWDLKPGDQTGGEFKPIKTKADGVEISEVLPTIAEPVRRTCRIVRSLVTNEGSHERGTVLMNTGRQPNPVVQYPAMGAVASSLLTSKDLPLPGFIGVGGTAQRIGPGFLGMMYAPFTRAERRPAAAEHLAPRQPRHQRRAGRTPPPPSAPVQHPRRRLRRARHLPDPQDAGRAREPPAAPPRPTSPSTRRASTSPFRRSARSSTSTPRTRRPSSCTAARRTASAWAACWPASWSRRASPPSRWTSAAGTTTPTSSTPSRTRQRPAPRQGHGRPGQGPRGPRHVEEHRRAVDGRVRPHAAHQPEQRPRPLGAVLVGGAGRRRHQGRPGLRLDQQGRHGHPGQPATLGDLFATVYKGMGLDASTQIRDNLGRPLPIADGKPLKGLV